MMMIRIASVLLLFIFPLVSCNDIVLKPEYIRGNINSPRNLPGVYMVEFSTSMKDHGKESILNHVRRNALPGNSHPKITFRTKTRTTLFHGHSFRVHGDFEEKHLLEIPGAINVYRVSLVQAPKPIKTSTADSSGSTLTLDSIHSTTGVLDARNILNLLGEGISVAVIDDGVYYLHPALGGCFGQGCKVAVGYDFVGDEYDGSNDPIPDADPLDTCSDSSHGTHVAGIVAANASSLSSGPYATFPFTGVAPGATIGAYRVFGCSGPSGFDIIVAAAYQAAEDGADVLNLSLAGGPEYADFYFFIALSRISAAGHIVVQSNGNNGELGIMFSASAGSELLSIASFDNLVYYSAEATATVDGVSYPCNVGQYNANFDFPETLQIVVNDINAIANNVQNDGCTAVSPASSAGQTVLLRYAFGCGSYVQCENAFTAGFARCLLYSDDEFMFTIYGSPSIPSALISQEAGAAIVAAVAAGQIPAVVIAAAGGLVSSSTAGSVSSFSSRGLTNELAIKPDIGGIGGKVYSTISPAAMQAQNSQVPYAVLSYVSGAIALLLESQAAATFSPSSSPTFSPSSSPTPTPMRSPTRSPSIRPSTKAPTKAFPPSKSPVKSKKPTAVPSKAPKYPRTKAPTQTPSKTKKPKSPSAKPTRKPKAALHRALSAGAAEEAKAHDFVAIRTMLQNTATPRPVLGSEVLDSVAYQGAGLVNIYNAILSKTLVTPSAFELNDTEFSQPYYNMTVHNMYSTAIVYNLTSVGAATINPFIEGNDSVQMQAAYSWNCGSVRFFDDSSGSYSAQMLLSVPAGQSAVVQVMFSAPADASPELFRIYSGYVTVSATGSAAANPTVRVPYAGMVGRWKQAAVWSRQSEFGAAGFYDRSTFEVLSEGAAVSATNGTILYIAVSTASRFGRVEVVSQADGSSYNALVNFLDSETLLPTGDLFPLYFSPLYRNAPDENWSPYITLWTGLVIPFNMSYDGDAIQLGPGQYTLSFLAQKHFGNATDPLDTISTTVNLTA